ncbi:MAG TPA: prolipoprotein diacylglyceryl transferase [Dehalococcoidia bacterium]|nr:prolipoprotein diacylglyceryl transferase [Dehalococcoidia bacterium]
MQQLLSALFFTIEIPLDPNLFEIGGLEISWHGVFTAIGVIVGVAIAAYFARREGFSEDHIYNAALALVVGGIIGARALFVIENWDRFEDDPGDIFALNAGGISIYGALIGGTLAAWGYCLIVRLPNIPRAADVAALGAILGMAIGRIGDVINGEHYAEATSLPWGVKYTDPDSPGFLTPLGQGAVSHPAVAYELLADLAIFAVLLLLYLRVHRHGVVFFSWAFLYSAMRLGISFLRLDDTVFLGLRTAQVIAVIVMAISLPALAYLLNHGPTQLTRAERRRLGRTGRQV